MSECAWVARIEDKETNQVTRYPFRYYGFATPSEALAALQIQLSHARVLDVSTNPYEWKELSRY